jgi:ADP-ribose pyrophosphatase
MTSPSDFKVLASEHHYRGWVIDVHTDVVRMPDGSQAKRDVVGHSGAVAVVALDDQDRVVTVRQYRHPVGDFLLELPAGLLDVPGEPALAAAKRELFEEAAVTADDWAVLVDLYTSPGMTDEAIRVFLARGLHEVPAGQRFEAEHEETSMTVQRYPLEELTRMAVAGELTNGPAVAAIGIALFAQARGWDDLRPADAPWPGRPLSAG